MISIFKSIYHNTCRSLWLWYAKIATNTIQDCRNEGMHHEANEIFADLNDVKKKFADLDNQ